jgi:hypothetical protein
MEDEVEEEEDRVELNEDAFTVDKFEMPPTASEAEDEEDEEDEDEDGGEGTTRKKKAVVKAEVVSDGEEEATTTLIQGRAKRKIKKNQRYPDLSSTDDEDDPLGGYSRRRRRGTKHVGPGRSCSVPGCEMTDSVAATFDDKSGRQKAAIFEFPEEEHEGELRDKWVMFCKGGDASTSADKEMKMDGVCSMHFLRSSMTNLYNQ